MGFASLNPEIRSAAGRPRENADLISRQGTAKSDRPRAMSIWHGDDREGRRSPRPQRMTPPRFAKCLAEELDVLDEQPQAAFRQLDREEEAVAGNRVAPVVGHRYSIARRQR